MDSITSFDESQQQSHAGPSTQLIELSDQIQIQTQNPIRPPRQIKAQPEARVGPKNLAMTKKTLFTPSHQQPIPTGYEKRFYRPDFDKLQADQRFEVGVLKWEEDGRVGMSSLSTYLFSLTSSSLPDFARLLPPSSVSFGIVTIQKQGFCGGL